MTEPDGFREFVAARSGALLRGAWLLTGDWHLAQDLGQATLASAWVRWGRLRRVDSPEAYVRKVMVTTFLSWRRRRSWNERTVAGPTLEPTDTGAPDLELGVAVRQALAALPPRQRAVVMLRYFEDLTEAQTAEVLGCAVGTVKSQHAKAVARLRSSPQLAGLLVEEAQP